MYHEDIDLIHKQFYKILIIILDHNNQLGKIYFIFRCKSIHIEIETSINSEDASLFNFSHFNSFLGIQRNTNAL